MFVELIGAHLEVKVLGAIDFHKLTDHAPVLFVVVPHTRDVCTKLWVVNAIQDFLIPVASEGPGVNTLEIGVPERLLALLVLEHHEK